MNRSVRCREPPPLFRIARAASSPLQESSAHEATRLQGVVVECDRIDAGMASLDPQPLSRAGIEGQLSGTERGSLHYRHGRFDQQFSRRLRTATQRDSSPPPLLPGVYHMGNKARCDLLRWETESSRPHVGADSLVHGGEFGSCNFLPKKGPTDLSRSDQRLPRSRSGPKRAGMKNAGSENHETLPAVRPRDIEGTGWLPRGETS